MNLNVIELQVKDFKRSLVYKKIFKTLRVEEKKKGIKISPITKVHWGRKFSFAEPEGNKHFVYEEKG